MKTFEYFVRRLTGDPYYDHKNQLDELGFLGWELVSIVGEHAYMKRRL